MWSRVEALAMERRHVAEGEERCARQRALIVREREHARNTAEAERLLTSMENFVELARNQVKRLEKQDR